MKYIPGSKHNGKTDIAYISILITYIYIPKEEETKNIVKSADVGCILRIYISEFVSCG